MRSTSTTNVPIPAVASRHCGVQEDVEATVAAWSIYGAYAKEKDELLAVQWAEARLQLHRVDDFIGRWLKSATALDDSPMKLTLLRELDSYRRCDNLAGLCAGCPCGPVRVITCKQCATLCSMHVSMRPRHVR